MREFLRNQLVRFLGKLRTPEWESTDGPIYRFLTYHRIKPHQQVAFQQQLDRLKSHYNLISPRDFETGRGKSGKLNLLLTFDDGYLEWETFVWRELEKRAIRAIFFVTPDFVGLNRSEAGRFCRMKLQRSPAHPLTEDGLEYLRESEHTLGNHLVSHPDLRNETDPTRLRNIFSQSQETFQSRFNIEPHWVAYPFANYFEEPETIKETARDWFEYGVSLTPGWNRQETDRMLLNRDGFSPNLSPSVEKNWLRGGYDSIFKFTHLMK